MIFHKSIPPARWQLLASQTEPVNIGVLKEQLLEKEKAKGERRTKIMGIIFFLKIKDLEGVLYFCYVFFKNQKCIGGF